MVPNEVVTSSVVVPLIEYMKKSDSPILKWISDNGETPATAMLVSLVMSVAAAGITGSYDNGRLVIDGLTPDFIQQVVTQFVTQHWLYKLYSVAKTLKGGV